MQETQTQREERKNMYISHILRHAKGVLDYEDIIEEAGQKWEWSNQSQKDE